MGHCDFRVHADFNTLIGLANRRHRIRESKKGACLTIVHRSKLSALTVAATVILQIGCIVATAGAVSKSASISPELLTCSARFRTLSVNASSTWQEVTVNGTDTKFTGDCEVSISFTSRITKVSLVYADWQPTLLVKLYGMQVLPANSKCSFGNLTLSLLSVLSHELQSDLCDANAVSAFYIWVSQPVRVYLYAWPTSDIRASFSVAFVAVRAFDVCQNLISPSKMLRVDEESYVFAPNSVYVDFLKNSSACSGSKQLRLATSSPFNALNVTVLAAPTNSSCWSLWLDELRISAAGTQSFVVGANVTLLYELNDSTSGCNSSAFQQGFTIKAFAVSPEATSSISVSQHNPREIEATTVQEFTTQREDVPERTKIVAAAASTVSIIVVVLIGGFVLYRCRRHLSQQRMLQEENLRKQCELTASTSSTYEHVNRFDEQHEYSGLDKL